MLCMDKRLIQTAAGIAVAATSFVSSASQAQSAPAKQNATISTFTLISNEDLAQWTAQSQPQPGTKGAPPSHTPCDAKADTVAPAIKVITPDIGHPVHAPVNIELGFSPAPGTHVVPSSFRVCYLGFVTIDITDRLVGHSTLTDTGLQANGAMLPNGIYHLRLLLEDDAKRIGKTEITIHVY
jgi:hypothetical protein